MIVNNTTPFFHATLHTSRKPPQPEMLLVVRGTFRMMKGALVEAIEDIEQGFLSGDVYADDDDERSGELVYPTDFADFKLSADVMLVGSCHPPELPARECPVRFTVGEWKKELMVRGDRTFKRGLTTKASEPEPFDSMPLDYAHAFGGPEFAHNPVGRGNGGDDRLPNVELVNKPLQRPDQQVPPGSFAPISPSWPLRADKVGKDYGGSYLKERAPYYSADHDWRSFSAAPADQQLEGFLTGDEHVVLQNLHPGEPVFKTQLPGLRLRAFVKDETGTIRPIGMVLDTLLCEPDEGRLKLTWRGLIDVADDDLLDVTHVHIASEPLDSEPLPDAHYHAALEAFVDDPLGLKASIPQEMVDEFERLQKQRRGEPVADREVDPALDPMSAKVKQAFGPLVSDDDLAPLGRAAAKMKELGGDDAPDIEAELAKAPPKKDPPQMKVIKPGRRPDPRLRERMREVMAEAAKLREAEKTTGKEVDGVEQLEALPRDEMWKKLDPDYQPPGPLSTDEPGPGADLSERDFSEQDLSGVDLSGANLERTNFCGANLRGANLRGANLRHALLYLTNLEGADLREADLTLVNGICMRASGADFSGATLNEACFEEATLVGAKLDKVAAEYVVFQKAALDDVSAEDGHFDNSDFSKATLSGAKLPRSSAQSCLFAECKADRLDMSDASLEAASFIEAELAEARFVGAKAAKAFFMKANIDGADFGYADLCDAHLSQASAKAGRFYGTNLKGARLYRANLDGAQLVKANLMSCDLRKAKVDSASFAHSNLYDAKLLKLRGSGFDLTGANTERALFDPS